MRIFHAALGAALLSGVAACTPREVASEPGQQSVAIRLPQERSYLEPGPSGSTGRGPSYVVTNEAGSVDYDRRFRGDSLPRIP